MASRISAVTGNFTTAGTWGAVETAGEIDSEAGTVAISTSNIDSPTFTPSATALDGIALKLSARAASPTGTFTVTLRNSTTATDVKTVTVNVSDLPTMAGSKPEWCFFKFASTTTPNGTDLYVVRVVCSNTGSQVTLHRSTTGTNNFSKKIRNTTTGAPASGEHVIICNQLTGAGASTAVTVTMDDTSGTSYGPTVSGGPPQGMVISGGGTLTFATSGALTLKVKGVLLIAGSGTMNIGANGAELSSSASATITHDAVATLDSGMEVAGTINVYGAPKTSITYLTADAAAAATTIAVNDKTGWQNSDELYFAPTGANSTEGEKKTINSAATPTLTAGLTNAHSGTAPLQAEVANLTRNIKFTGVDATHRGYIFFAASAGGTMRHFMMTFMGANSTNKRCLDIQTTAASAGLNLEDGVVHDVGNNLGDVVRVSGSTADKFYVRRMVLYNVNPAGVNVTAATSGTNWEVSGCLFAGTSNADTSSAFTFTDCGGIIKNNIVAGKNADITAFSFQDASIMVFDETNHGGNVAHNCVGVGLGIGNSVTQTCSGIVASWKSYLCGRSGFSILASGELTIKDPELFGNQGGNGGNLDFGGVVNIITLLDGYIANSSIRTSPLGITFAASAQSGYQYLKIRGTTLGVASGILTGHSTAEFGMNSGGSSDRCRVRIDGENVTLDSATLFQSGFFANQIHSASFAGFQKFDATTADHRRYFKEGSSEIDAAVYNTAAPSQKITPVSATLKARSTSFKKPATSGGTVTISVQVRKSAAYNGNQPRLMMVANAALGLGNVDVVGATYSGGTGSFALLTYTTGAVGDDGVVEFYVDCDGTAGVVNVDDWS